MLKIVSENFIHALLLFLGLFLKISRWVPLNMLALKDTAVCMYKAAIHRYIFYLEFFGEVNVNENCKRKFCYPTCHTLSVF